MNNLGQIANAFLDPRSLVYIFGFGILGYMLSGQLSGAIIGAIAGAIFSAIR